MFGRNTDMVKETLAQKTGVSSGQIAGVLVTLAHIVMGYLGKQKESTDGGLGDILGGLVGGPSNSAGGGLLGSVLGGSLGGGDFSKSQGVDRGSRINVVRGF